jgi:hypothetical protein
VHNLSSQILSAASFKKSLRRKWFCSVVAVAIPLFTGIHSTRAGVVGAINGPAPVPVALTPSAVILSDRFDIDVYGYVTAGVGGYLAGPFDPVFGTTQTYVGGGLGSQTVAVASSELVGPVTTTDTISISVPTDFDPSGTTFNGSPITLIQAEIGGYNAGTDNLDLTSSEPSASGTGYTIFNLAGNISPITTPLFPQVNLENSGSSVEAVEGLTGSAHDLAAYAFHDFTFAISYPTVVPEPKAAMILLLGLVTLGGKRRCSY